MDLTTDQTFFTVFFLISVFLGYFSKRFAPWWKCGFPVLFILPEIVPKKDLLSEKACFMMDLKTEQTFVTVFPLHSLFKVPFPKVWSMMVLLVSTSQFASWNPRKNCFPKKYRVFWKHSRH